MQQYQNPNFYGQQQFMQPQFNPYLQRMENLQQFQQAIQQPQIAPAQVQTLNQFPTLGKMVESIDIVKATDIPIDGNIYYFPKADGTEIYSKTWLPNGQTRILTFKPILEDNPNILSSDEEELKFNTIEKVLGGIQNDIKTINEKIDKMNKSTRNKKEVVEDE